MRIKLIVIFLVIVFICNLPAAATDLGYLDAKYGFICYVIGFASVACLFFVICFVGTKRVFSNFLIFIGINLLNLALMYGWYMYMYANQFNPKKDFILALAFVGGFILTSAGWLLHSFLDVGVAAKSDYKKVKDKFTEHQKKHHDPENLR